MKIDTTQNSISIIGCGWLGSSLYSELKNEYKNIICYPDNNFYDSDIFIIAINTKRDYIKTLQVLCSLIPKDSTVILCSSTSVYREFDESIDEESIITKQSLQRDAEIVVSSLIKHTIILRLGGLMGYDRVAGRWSKVSSFEDGYTNYIHRDDAIAIIKQLIKSSIKNAIFNLVAPLHPKRSTIHSLNAKKFNFTLGSFNGFSNRIILSDKIVKTLGYKFLYPDPTKFWD